MTLQSDHDGAQTSLVHSGHSTTRRSDIQGLRAVAVALVVAFHAGLPLPGGFIGVDMFFVISGFVIAGMLLGELERGAGLSFAAFYTRRIRRLLPALAVLTMVVALASVFLLSPLGPQQATAKTGLAASIFSANIELSWSTGGGYFATTAEANALLHTWSLSVEEQFYFAFPAILAIAWRLASRSSSQRSRNSRIARYVLAATAASFALSCYASYSSSYRFGTRFAFYSPMTRAWEFGIGVLIFLVSPALLRFMPRIALPMGVAGIALIVIGVFTIRDTTPFPGVAAVVPVAGTGLLLAAGVGATRGVNAVLGARPAVWVGDVSYGWYLWHWPLIVFAAAMWPDKRWACVLAALVSLGPTLLSSRFIENPIRFNDRITGRRAVALAALCILLPIVACFGLLFANRLETRSAAITAFSEANRGHADSERGCDGARLSDAPPGCTWRVDNPKGTVVLVGDSNAGQFTEPAAVAANRLGYNLTVATASGCPFVDLLASAGANDGIACHRRVVDSMATLRELRPSLVILASSSADYVTSEVGTWQLRDPRTGEAATTPEAAKRLWDHGLTSVLKELDEAGTPTAVVQTAPHPGDVDPSTDSRTCPAVGFLTDSCGRYSIARANVERWQQPARDAQNQAVARIRAATAVDFTDDLCSPEACNSERDGVLLYRSDGGHLSVDGSLTLTDRFSDLIGHRAVQS